MKDEGIDRAIRNTLAERGGREQETCPDDSRIAAYLDSRLLPEENAEFEAHAAHCETCREILALSMRLGEEDGAARTALPGGSTRVLFHFAIPASALALLVIVLGAGIFYFRAMRNAGKAPADTRIADARIPAKPSESPQLSRVPESELPESAASPRKSRNEKGSMEPRRRDFSPEIPVPAREEYKDEAPGGTATVARAGRDKGDAPAAFRAERTELKAESAIVAGAPKAGPDTVSQPPVPAGRFRSLQANPTGAPAGTADAAGAIQLQKAAVSDEAQTTEAGRHASGKPTKGAGPRDTREIRDRTFVRTQDIWVDNECKKHPEASVIVILPDSEEYQEILEDYPELRELRPVMIFREGRKLLLR